MINAKNLLLSNTPQLSSSSSSSSPDSINDPLNLAVLNEDELKNELDDQSALDPNAFVLLLNQTFSTQQSQIPLDKPIETSANQEGGNPIVQSSATQAPIVDLNTTLTPSDVLVNSSFQENHEPITGLDNPALNWIDSESYQSLSLPVETDQAMLDQALGLMPQGSLKTAQAAASIDTQTSVNEESLPLVNSAPKPLVDSNLEVVKPVVEGVKNTVAQTIQQLTPTSTINYNVVLNEIKQTDQNDSISPDLMNSNLHRDLEGAVLNTQPQTAPAQQAPTHTPKSLEITVPVNHAQWGDKFADHIVWLGRNEIQSALIKLHPEDLGPIEISVKVVKDSASVNIISHSLQVRDLMDQALPKLREMMADQGLNLSNVQISSDSRSNNQSTQNNNSNAPYESSFIEAEDEVVQVTSVKKPPKGLIDYFA